MRAHGRVNIVAVVLMAAVVGGLYWVIMFSSVYLDNLDVKEAVAAAYNQSARASDDTLRGIIKGKLGQVGTHKEDDGYGTVTVQKGLGLKDEDITITRDEVRKTISIRVEYSQEVQLKPLKKIKLVRFTTQTEGPVPAQ